MVNSRQFRLRWLALLATSVLAASCAAIDPENVSDSPKLSIGVGTPVPAAGETPKVGTDNRDAADDPELWADPKDPSRGVILGTDKQSGLYVYDLKGVQIQFLPQGRLNNVDLRGGFTQGGTEKVLVAASNRTPVARGVSFFLLDPATLKVEPWGFAPTAVSEPYGFCMGRWGAAFIAVMVGETGDVKQYRVTDVAGKPTLTEERSFSVGSQSEGCVVDDVTGALYVAEEAKGVWRYALDPAAGDARTLVAGAPSEMLKPDVEGLTLLREGAKTWLIASSQGDSAFGVWRVDGAAPVYSGRFSVVGGAGADPVTGTDGVAALGGPVGDFPEGLVVMQDDSDTEGEGQAPASVRNQQNFKLVDWRAVKAALNLR